MSDNTKFRHYRADEKHFFAGFFNLAEDNLKSTIQEFRKRLILEDLNDFDKNIDNWFSNQVSFTDYDRRIEILSDYFPVINIINVKSKGKQDRAKFRKAFKLLANSINTLRNYYSHFYHEKITLNSNLFSVLDEILKDVIFEVRNRKLQKRDSKLYFKKKFEIKFQDLNEDELTKEIKKSFRFILYKLEIKEKFKSKFTRQDLLAEDDLNVGISLSGLLTLLSLFLSRKDSEMLLSGINEFDKTETFEDIARRNIYTYLSFKGLKRRIRSSYPKEALLMQMIDELTKCPAVIYENLSDDKKLEFIEDINEYYKDPSQNVSSEESRVSHQVIRKRYQNKFPYFAIRFLDEFAEFPNLKFRVFVGKYTHDQKEKPLSGGMFYSNRIIQENIYAFGKLSRISKVKADYFDPLYEELLEERKNVKPINIEKDKLHSNYELFPNPSYGFQLNNIPILLEREDPEVFNDKTERKKDKLKKEEILRILFKQEEIKYDKPTLLLSNNELPAMLHKFLIKDRSVKSNIDRAKNIEELLSDEIKTHIAAIKGDNANNKLPRKLKKLSNEQSYLTVKLTKGNETKEIEKIVLSLEHEINVSNNKLAYYEELRDRFENLQDKFNNNDSKYFFNNKERGDEAVWLADDIKRFMPQSVRDAWKGYQHAELQKLLAFYDYERDYVLMLINAAWDIKDPFDPGIREALKETCFRDFYKRYFIIRRDFFMGLKDRWNSYRDNPKIRKKLEKQVFRFFKRRKFVVTDKKSYVERIINDTVYIPRGVFDKKPTWIPGKTLSSNPKDFADWFRHANIHKDQFQKFYNEDFIPSIESLKTLKELENSDNQKFNWEKYKRWYVSSIKKSKIEDIYIKEMVNYLLKEIFGQSKVRIQLNDIFQWKEERYEADQKALLQSQRAKGNESENIYNERQIWNMTVPFSISGGRIKEENIRLKDIGKFRSLENNNKVKKILAFENLIEDKNENKRKVWSKLAIENELDSYELVRRKKIIKEVHDLEQLLLEKRGENNHPKDFELNGNPNFTFYILNGLLSLNIKSHETDEENAIYQKSSFKDLIANNISDPNPSEIERLLQAEFLMIIRNKFLHNQFPSTHQFIRMQEFESFDLLKHVTYAEYFLVVFQKVKSQFDI